MDTGRGAGMTEKSGQPIKKIPPIGVLFFDQFKLPTPAPFLDPLFPQDCVRHGLVEFNIDQHMSPILLAEAIDHAGSMIVNSARKIAGDTDVKSAVALTGKDVYAGSFHAHQSYVDRNSRESASALTLGKESSVIPAKAGIQAMVGLSGRRRSLDSRFRGNDEKGRRHVTASSNGDAGWVPAFAALTGRGAIGGSETSP